MSISILSLSYNISKFVEWVLIVDSSSSQLLLGYDHDYDHNYDYDYYDKAICMVINFEHDLFYSIFVSP